MTASYTGVKNSAFGGFSATVSTTITPTGTNRALFALVGIDTAADSYTIDSCAISGGASFTAAAAQFLLGGTYPARLFYLAGDANVPNTSCSVVGTISGTGHHPWIIVLEYQDCGGVTVRSNANGNNRSPSITVTSSAGNEVVGFGLLNYDATYLSGGNTVATAGTLEQLSAEAGNTAILMLLDRDGATPTVSASVSGGVTPYWYIQGFDLAPTTSVTTTKYYPGSDIAAGTWTKSTGGGTSLYTMIDEPTTPSDTDYIQSAQNPVADLVKIKFGGVGIPGSNQGANLRMRLKSDGNCPVSWNLYCGATQISSGYSDGSDLSAFTTYTISLTTTQVDTIKAQTDPTDIQLWVQAN